MSPQNAIDIVFGVLEILLGLASVIIAFASMMQNRQNHARGSRFLPVGLREQSLTLACSATREAEGRYEVQSRAEFVSRKPTIDDRNGLVDRLRVVDEKDQRGFKPSIQE
ncbi:MAG: hypothetical protein M1827_006337 [Pycnora praestabilis]|nr:MAG: hypothetical protein M1827_006337 [Pycnora praestabilis]